MNKTSIEWTDFTANPVKFRAPDGRVVWACEKLSPGCKNCYAESLSHRYGGVRRAGEWNAATMATLTPFLDESELLKMRTAKTVGGRTVSGSRCFIGDMTDIFGEWVPDNLLNRLFSQVLEQRQDVTWQLLTKRAERMQRYLSWRYGPDEEAPRGRIPSRNIHVGVSMEDQPRVDERLAWLLQTPAAVRFLSVEPLLAATNLRLAEGFCRACKQFTAGTITGHCFDARSPCFAGEMGVGDGIDWVIVGGESGPGARPFDVAWARSIVAQCQAAGVPVFVKQLGAAPIDGSDGHAYCANEPHATKCNAVVLRDRKGGEMAEWPEDLRVREFPGAA